jgi:ubiquinone/menaquinone biosynthesis C-methylase UbiE
MSIGMESAEYTLMQEMEETMWWYHGLHANVLQAIAAYAPGFKDLLDAGCGTGGMLKLIRDTHPAGRLHGLDISEQACAAAHDKSRASIVVGSADALPYPDQAFDVLISLDVLNYDLDISAAVGGFFRVLRPGGYMILNLAAYPWMLSYHDRAVGQCRRFTRPGAKAMLQEQGFRIVLATYWNTVLFPLMVLRRKLSPASAASDVKPFHPLVNGMFKACLAAERAFIRRGLAMPFGGSILIVAQRPSP